MKGINHLLPVFKSIIENKGYCERVKTGRRRVKITLVDVPSPSERKKFPNRHAGGIRVEYDISPVNPILAPYYLKGHPNSTRDRLEVELIQEVAIMKERWGLQGVSLVDDEGNPLRFYAEEEIPSYFSSQN